jgi:hypothetical protein
VPTSQCSTFGEEQAKRFRVDGQRNDLVVCCGTSPGNALGGISGTCLRQLQFAHVGAEAAAICPIYL